MKILIATDSMDIGGAETHVFTLINEIKKDHSVTLISAGGVYSKLLEKSGLRCVFAPFNKRDPISIIKSKRLLKEEMGRADIVHTHTRFTSFLANSIRGKSKFPSIVTTAHLNFPIFPFGAFAFWGDSTLAVSEDIRQYLEENYGIDKNDVFLTKNALDLELYKRASLERKVIIHTSRIDKGRAKTAFLLTEAATDILKRHNDWRIIIVGDGNLFKKLSKKASAVNLELGFDGVILTGARSDIPSLLSYASIFVGVSRSALEGMASGLPTIISGDEGYGGIAGNENFDLLSLTNFCARGLKLPQKDILIDDIEKLICDSDLRKSLGAELRKSIELYYQSEAMANDALECYNHSFKRPSICLMGFFGYRNLGDEETLSSAINTLLELGISDISVLAASHKYSREFPTVKIYDRMNPMDINNAIEKSDVFVLCGGNLMQNETSLRSLIYYEQVIRIAKRKGKRIYFLSSGFGEIHGNFAKLLLKRGLNDCSFCGCRTKRDLDIARKYTENSFLMPDLCFLLPEQNSKPQNKTFVWILSDKNTIKIEDVLDISRQRSLTPIAVNLFKDNDSASAVLAQKHGISVIAPKNYKELSETLRSADFSISERLHGSIFSIISHVPTFITESNEKNRALLEEIKSRIESAKIILPYAKNDVVAKKEIGACDSDFNYVIDSLKHDIHRAFHEIF